VEKAQSPKWSRERMEGLRSAIEDLMLLRASLRPYAPDFQQIEELESKQMNKLLKRSAKQLLPLFEELGLCSEGSNSPKSIVTNHKLDSKDASSVNTKKESIETGVELLQTIGENYLFIGSNSIKKQLKGLGVEPNKIIVAGGPVHVDDLKKLNPNIPDAALQGYQKKIDVVVKTLKDAFTTGKKVIFCMSPADENDQIIAGRLSDLEQKIGSKFEKILIKSWEKL
jgi:precorrin-4 methylase